MQCGAYILEEIHGGPNMVYGILSAVRNRYITRRDVVSGIQSCSANALVRIHWLNFFQTSPSSTIQDNENIS